jgi:ectoine hydroxylase-related dioxygenase (phytanoyl-CoA dioxygenase family)
MVSGQWVNRAIPVPTGLRGFLVALVVDDPDQAAPTPHSIECDPMTDDELYLFDLNGYLLLEAMLSPAEVLRANDAIDHQIESGATQLQQRPAEHGLAGGSKSLVGTSRRMQLTGNSNMLAWPRPYCEPFREMLVHPYQTACLNAILGERYRADAGPSFMATDQGAEGHALHGGGGDRPNLSEAYFFKNNSIYSGMVVVEIALADEGDDDGGLAVIPGSHKSNLPCPRAVRLWEEHQSVIKKIPLEAGDGVIFTETLTHGALPWQAAHQRRIILTRYTPGYIAYHGVAHAVITGADYLADMTEQQQAVLATPSHR